LELKTRGLEPETDWFRPRVNCCSFDFL